MTDSSSDPLSTALGDFLRTLFADGNVTVPTYVKGSSGIDDGDASVVLEEAELAFRVHLAGPAPGYQSDAALWASRQYYRACQLLVCREIPAEEVIRVMAISAPNPRDAKTDYSVDLVFRFLPDLFDVAHRLAPEDALAKGLKQWAETWPLSSVGISVSENLPLSFLEHPSLRQLYADRIVARQAIDRINDLRLRAQLGADLGLYPELSFVTHKALQRASAG